MRIIETVETDPTIALERHGRQRRSRLFQVLALALVMLSWPMRVAAADLKPQTIQAWEAYLQAAKARNHKGLAGGSSFLSIGAEPADSAKLRQGEVIVSPAWRNVPVTGALQRRVGRFELAEGGTIFLDEVGELLPDTQVALLRVLQEREFERVGGGQSIRVDVRVVAATNRDLKAAVAKGTFREDLYYRLHVFPLDMPPLRARRADIPLLVEYFIDRYARKAGKNIRRVDEKTLRLLQSYPWHGNIRELQNVIERSIIVCETETFTVDESWLSQRPVDTGTTDLSEKVAAT
jgi:hypothetical protein